MSERRKIKYKICQKKKKKAKVIKRYVKVYSHLSFKLVNHENLGENYSRQRESVNR